MIIVSSYDRAAEAFRRHQPEFVVSVLDPDEEPAPTFEGLPPENHLVLRDRSDGQSPCRDLIALAERWDQRRPVLIHCHQGACRSMAAAYILLCAVEADTSESAIASRLRAAAPHADPNLLLVSEADALLGRDDRMVEAVLDLCPCAGTVCEGIVTLPLAA